MKDDVWNRALGPDHSGFRMGDLALRDALRFHSQAMSGGALSAFESLAAEEVEAAVQGFTYFRVSEAADAVRWLAEELRTTEPDDDEALDALEAAADDRYNAAVPTDSVLVDALEKRYDASPEAFAPVG